MRIYKGIIYTGLGHLSKLLLGFALLKLIANYQGSAGLGYIGNFMSLVTLVVSMAGGGVTNAVIKYTAEYKTNEVNLSRFFSTAAFYSLAISIFLFCIFLFFAEKISFFIFKSNEYYSYFLWLAIFQFIFAFNNFYSGYLNGLGRNLSFSVIQIISALIALPVIWYLIAKFSLDGAVIAILITYSFLFFGSFFLFNKENIYQQFKLRLVNVEDIKKLFKFMLITAVSAAAFPLAEIMVRGILISSGGYAQAGLWQGAMKLSGAYIGFFSTFLAFYFVPRISSSNEKEYIKKFSIITIISVAFMFLIGASVFWIFREKFIVLFLSRDFIELKDSIQFQLIGDTFRIMAYVIGFLLIAKAAILYSVLAEILQNFLFFVLVKIFDYQITVSMVMKIYALNYLIYFLICFVGLMVYVKKPGSDK